MQKLRIGIVVPPFITVPPRRYGGTELFVAHLAEGLRDLGHWPVVYTVGTSQVACETRWREMAGRWPIESPLECSLDDLDHSAWACADAMRDCDVIHLNNAPGLTFSRFVDRPMVYTLHHPHEPALSRYYAHFPEVHYVAISRDQARRERLPRLDVIHHGLRVERYRAGTGGREYLAFIGRICPVKGTHIAVAVARKAGIPLRIAGEIQPAFRSYWEREIRPHVDGRRIQYLGEADHAMKCELLAGARAVLFPIEWEEPFGLVMIEAMACGAPVLAFARGSAPEIVVDGVSGWICPDLQTMVRRAQEPAIAPERCRT
ncbi:MAG: glycosyltransferase family 4 protein, partial [Terriglobales bacterium]